MYSRTTTIINETGLHARPASDFIKAASGYASDITIKKVDGAPVNAKSIVLLLALGLSQGTQVEISATGADEQAAVDGLIALLDSGFGE